MEEAATEAAWKLQLRQFYKKYILDPDRVTCCGAQRVGNTYRHVFGLPFMDCRNVRHLLDAGFTLEEFVEERRHPCSLIERLFSMDQFLTAGVSAYQLKLAGFKADEIKEGGHYSLHDLKTAGFTALACKQANFSAEQLRDAGYSWDEVHVRIRFMSGEIVLDTHVEPDVTVRCLCESCAPWVRGLVFGQSVLDSSLTLFEVGFSCGEADLMAVTYYG